MNFTVQITDASGALSKVEVDRVEAILGELGVPLEALNKRAIPETARDLGPRSKFQLVWITMPDEASARKIAEVVRERLGKTCQVSEARSRH